MMIKGRTTMNKVFQRVSQHPKQVKQLALKEFYNSGRYKIKRGGSMFIMMYLFNGMDTKQAFRISFVDTLGYKVRKNTLSLLGAFKVIMLSRNELKIILEQYM